jgi:hypothetical protein
LVERVDLQDNKLGEAMSIVNHDLRGEKSTAPNALVVVESMFGNTEAVGLAVAEGLRLEGVQTETVTVTGASEQLPPGLDLLVVGAPTHAFSLSRPSTRTDAVRQGAPARVAATGLREWLTAVRGDGALPNIAVFDTRVTKVRWLPKAAGTTANRLARRRHFTALAQPRTFLVDDIKGPLIDGELEQAVAWGRSLAMQLVNAKEAATVSPTR